MKEDVKKNMVIPFTPPSKKSGLRDNARSKIEPKNAKARETRYGF